MKQFFYSLLMLSLLSLASCERRKTIPDKELAAIFHDAMVVNAYVGNQSIKLDSLNIYEPIFEHYGYTTEDVRYTIAGFLRRKSANLSDVAEYMILLLDREANALNLQVAKLDTIENVARRRFTKVMLADTAINVRDKADSSLMRFVVEPIYEGEYNISAKYTLDSLDKATGRRYRVYFERRDSSIRSIANGIVQRRKESDFSHRYEIKPADTNYVRLVIEMAHFADRKQKTTTRMKIHEVKVTHTPPTEECVDMLFNEQSGVRIFSDSLIRAIEEGARK